MAGAGQSKGPDVLVCAHTLVAVLSDAPVVSRNSETSDLICEEEGAMVGCRLARDRVKKGVEVMKASSTVRLLMVPLNLSWLGGVLGVEVPTISTVLDISPGINASKVGSKRADEYSARTPRQAVTWHDVERNAYRCL
jgi:hypothetical protein